jgi:hypothetical protein
MKFCPECGTKNEEYKFCPNCGFNFNSLHSKIGVSNEEKTKDSTLKALQIIWENGFCGIKNSIHQFITETKFDEAILFNDGYVGLKLNGKWGFINSNSTWSVRPNQFLNETCIVYTPDASTPSCNVRVPLRLGT